MVKWDEGTSTAIEEQHLDLLPEPAEGGEATVGDDEATGMSDYLTRDDQVTDDENEDVDVEGAVPEPLPEALEPVITPLQGIVQCGEYRWRRVKAIVNDARAEHAEFDFALRNVSLTETTPLNDLLWLCMPVNRSDMLATVRYRAGAAPYPKP
jgi:hypothetical protein